MNFYAVTEKVHLHDIRASQYNVEIDIGTSRDKGHFFHLKLTNVN